jgi:hypothetical protein
MHRDPAASTCTEQLTCSGVAGPSAFFEADASLILRRKNRRTSSLFEVPHLPPDLLHRGEVQRSI